MQTMSPPGLGWSHSERGPLRAVHLSRHKWPLGIARQLGKSQLGIARLSIRKWPGGYDHGSRHDGADEVLGVAVLVEGRLRGDAHLRHGPVEGLLEIKDTHRRRILR